MNLLRHFLRARLTAHRVHHHRRDAQRRTWSVTVPPPRGEIPHAA